MIFNKNIDNYTLCLFFFFFMQGCGAGDKWNNCIRDANGAPKTGVLKNGLVTLWKITPSDARNVTATCCCYISALVLTCFRLKKGCATFFWPETIVAIFLHLMVLFFKVLLNHSSKRQFLVLHWRLFDRCSFYIIA